MNTYDKVAIFFLAIAMTGVVRADFGLALWGDLSALVLMLCSAWARWIEQKRATRSRRMM